jgi:parallel beta-helix repeat protein
MVSLFSLSLMFLWSGQLYSQDPIPAECGMDSTYQVEHEPSSGQEGGSSNGHLCAIPNGNHIVFSDLPRHMPQGERIRIRANFIILQKQDGTGNFQDIPEHRALLNDWFDHCNEVFANTWWGSQSNCLPAADNAGIEIVPNWIFLPDPSGSNYYWDLNNAGSSKTSSCPNFGSWWLNGLDQIINNDPAIPRGINVYFTVQQDIHDKLVVLGTIDNPEQEGMFYTWCSEHPTREDMSRPSRIHISNMFLKYFWFRNFEVAGTHWPDSRAWLVNEGRILAHEFGHSFIQEYVHFNQCTDHLMATAGGSRALRQLDVQYIHRGLVLNNIRQFIDCDIRYNASMYSSTREWTVANDEEWVNDMRIYHNLRIPAGVTLTIRCKLLLPEGGVVIVERGGRLIIDGGKVWRANTCSANQHWAGIAVKGNPTSLQPNPYGNLTANDGGVVLLIGDGEIEGAVIGVATQSHPHWDVPEDRGGLIQGEDFTFRDNVRGVQFMRYDLPNFSKFTDVKFINENGNATRGLTMWRTNNIVLDGCTFQNLTRNGIESWDASYNVSRRNRFINCTFNGITAGGSMPIGGFIQVGNINNFGSDRNRFINNTVGFRGSSNVFTRIHGNYMDNFDFDVAITGESDNDIMLNHFKANAAGVQLESTGLFGSVTDCNMYDGNIVGINIVGNNQSMSFWREQFGATQHDMFLEGLAQNPGRIMTNQGNTADARWNFFTGILPQQVKSSTVTPWNNTEHFYYFYPLNSSNPNVRPRCANNDPNCGLQSNFSIYEADLGNQDCGGLIPIQEVCDDRPCLDSLRAAIATLESQLSQSGSDTLLGQYEYLVARREKTVTQWLADYMEASDWIAAEELVASDPNPGNRRRQVALALWMDDFAKADSLLNVYPLQTNEDQQFVEVQTINRAFLADTAFQLTTSQENILYDVATSGTTQAGYAQTLLSLLAGMQIMPRLPVLEDEAEPRSAFAPESEAELILLVHPNPARDQVSVTWHGLGADAVTLMVSDAITGHGFYHNTSGVPFAQVLDCSNWPASMYIVTLRAADTGRLLVAEKLLITK